jgi:predicted nucleotidyltransferase
MNITHSPYPGADIQGTDMNSMLMSELLGGAARYKALRCLFEQPDKGFGARELASTAGIDPGNASRWLRRWAAVGLLDQRTDHRRTVYVASADPGLVPLRALLQQDSEVVRVLRESLDAISDEVSTAAIFGSVARGDTHADSDIDLLLVTDLSPLKAQAHFKPAGRTLGHAVNVLTFTQKTWDQAVRNGNELVADILHGAVIVLKGDPHAAQA